MASEKYLAIDIGASSGRAIVGSLDNGILHLEEMHRFENGPTRRGNSLFWDLAHIFAELKEGIRKSLAKYPDIRSMGIDTWGVDYVILKPDGSFARDPYNYRDSRTDNVPEEVFKIVPEPELYSRTGMQQMQLNTIYQLYAHRKAHPEDFATGNTLLMIPDAIAYLFCGDRTCEYTEASTSNLLNAKTRNWDWETIEQLGFRKEFFPRLTPPSTVAGKLRVEIARELGCPEIEVCKVGSHDTASAVASVPAPSRKNWVYISCGTWALFGAELDSPVLTEAARKASFTNEGGLNGKIRFLTNIIGMWLTQELRADWALRDGDKKPWSVIDRMALQAEGLKFIINPNHREFLSPGDMASKIRTYCEQTGQGTPNDAETIRCIYDSLSLCFRAKLEELQKLSGATYDCLNIVGGGSNALVLMQIATDICNVKVIAGPVEATATGNILSQAMAHGTIADLASARDVVRASFTPVIFEVKDHDRAKYDKAYARFLSLVNR
ncbi:MAG: Rhamnulokinase [Lentisphaerae bacterium ADurb.Bin242]|nr:MAG: Rhamnulokinase [Lentisphaerae bacterium ADurb.Bin242]